MPEYTGTKTDITGWVMSEHGIPQSKWKIIEFDHYVEGKNGKKREYWLAECTCEKHTRRVIERYGLLLGIYKNCGCTKKCNNLEGKKFGRLTVIKNLGIKKPPNKAYGRTVCLCRCDCGREVEIVANDMITGNVVSCGCQLREAQSKNGKKRHKTNTYDLSGEYGVGYCTNTGAPFYFDLEDYEKIKDYCWLEHISKTREGNKPYHSVRTSLYSPKRKVLTLAMILVGKLCDHINRNPMDNRKENLRLVSSRENVINVGVKKNNTSGVTGVYQTSKDGKWHSCVFLPAEKGKKKAKVRQFDSKESAIKSRLLMEKEVYGEFAPQRHLFAQYGIEDPWEEKR